MKSRTRLWSVCCAVALIPMLVSVPGAAADPSGDACVGGVDAGDKLSEGTPLEVFAGCKGKLHNAEEGSAHQDDWTDVYTIRVDGSGTAKLDWRLCNHDSEAFLVYEVYFFSDIWTPKRPAVGSLNPGTCTSDKPVTLESMYKPGEWRLMIYTDEAALLEGRTLPYEMYAQPLWR